MAIGTKYQLKFEEVTCPKTGKKFERLTPLSVLSHHPYFYNNIFTSDSKKMVFTSLLNGKNKQFYLLDLDTQIATQLTDDIIDGFGGAITKDDKYLFAAINNEFCKINLETMEREIVYSPKEGYITYDTPGISDCGRYIITMDWSIKDQETPGLEGWESFLAKGKKEIHSQLVIIDTLEKTSKVILDNEHYDYPNVKYKQWLGHPQFCNVDKDLVSYCHEGLGGTVDARLWFINSDGTNIRCARVHDYPTQIISHEFWFKNSRRIAYVKIESEDSPFSIVELLDADTLEYRDVVKLPRSSHFISSHNDKYIIADGDFYEDALYLFLVNVETGEYEPIVYHGSISYGRKAEVHAHPLFDNADEHVIFTSDFEGESAVYRVKI